MKTTPNKCALKILFSIFILPLASRTQNVQDSGRAFVFEENPGWYRVTQGMVGGAEIIAVVRMFKVKQRGQELKLARDSLKLSNDRLNELRTNYRSVSANSRQGLESRLQFLTQRLQQLQEYLNPPNLNTQSREEISQIQEQLVQKNVGLMRLEGTHKKQEMEAINQEIQSLQKSLRERLKTELSADPFVMKVEIDDIQREIGEIKESLRKGKVAGTPISSFDGEAAAIARQILTTERVVEADAERVTMIVRKLRSRGIFGRLKGTPFLTLMGDALLIVDALPRIGYLLTINDDPGLVGVDDTIITVKEVVYDRNQPTPPQPAALPTSPPRQ